MKNLSDLLFREYKRSVKTEEDWYPTVNGMVSCRIYLYEMTEDNISYVTKSFGLDPKNVKFCVRVCFWGGDDFGVESYRYFPSDKEAFKCYHEQVELAKIMTVANHSELKRIGFKNA